jgi:hypothetical protein
LEHSYEDFNIKEGINEVMVTFNQDFKIEAHSRNVREPLVVDLLDKAVIKEQFMDELVGKDIIRDPFMDELFGKYFIREPIIVELGDKVYCILEFEENLRKELFY